MPEDVNRQFGLTIRELRQKRRWSQETLAERTQLNRNFLSLIERGQRSPTLNTIARLARGLELPIADLMCMCQFEINDVSDRTSD